MGTKSLSARPGGLSIDVLLVRPTCHRSPWCLGLEELQVVVSTEAWSALQCAASAQIRQDMK
ncbi:hypothetical protein PsorP6_004094 [Peronosclerospora sorghi]|uniref:Uncharacterized protein n=1 Tax=Peronosclerospora sorghi TaxID=230839 RepID=A0ACC0VNC1_9STRA|nr:hypothetical protein PsorP6_004094 [Peronosclerospora sorghi]